MTNKPQFVGGKVRVSDVFDLRMGKTPSRKNLSYWHDGNHAWISIADLGSFGKYVGSTKERINDLAIAETGIKPAPGNTVLMSFKLSLGKAAITTIPVYTNEAIMAFVDKGVYPVDPSFMYHQCRAKDWTAGTNLAVMGKTLNKKTLGQQMVFLPGLAEQKTIARQLDFVERQLDNANEQLDQLDSLVKSRFVEMFGDTYLNSMNWTSCRLGDLISFMTSGSRGWARYYSDDGGYFLTIKNVRNCKIDISDVQHVVAPEGKESVRTKVKENDVLISITADLGRTGVVTKEIADHGAYINQHLACIRLIDDSVHSVFLSHFLESPGGINQFAKKNQNGVKAGLNFNLIRSLEIQMPPFALQQEFAAFVTQVDKSRFIAQQQIEKLQMLYDSLAQEYFGD